jgi:16S rRNA C1402 N4-methylase RsmH
MKHEFNSAMAFSKFYLQQNYNFDGEVVIDATVGNGYDTEWLMQTVGKTGHVHGFDIQQEALRATKKRLESSKKMTLHLDGHENLLKYGFQEIACVLYNLGYLPRGDKTIATQGKTTIQSIQAASEIIKVGGVIMIIAYPGHQSGSLECQKVESHLATYDQRKFQTWKFAFLNQKNDPPVLYGLEKRRTL